MPHNKLALISVSDKTNLLTLATFLIENGFDLIASGGTESHLLKNNIPVKPVSTLTNYPELLQGRVKTLHPAIHGGILAIGTDKDVEELALNKIELIDVVVCNLYPFKQTVQNNKATLEDAIENIDIGGVCLLRAAAKNYQRVYILNEPDQYHDFIKCYGKQGDDGLNFREKLALKAFETTSMYDDTINRYLNKTFNRVQNNTCDLRYGNNPHQKNALCYVKDKNLPFKVLNGQPGYINMLDALNAWQLVKELSESTSKCAATSFKHVSPAGVAIESSLTETEKKIYFVDNVTTEISPIASAYIRARGSDRTSSFGDFIALSSKCDVPTAKIISKEVSDGIIAPGYDEEAFSILKKKKNGKYLILEMDESYQPPQIETKQVYGITLQQERNSELITKDMFQNIVSKSKELPEQAITDMIVATTTLKYTQSNSVCLAKNGMTIGIGAGQQSRIHCTRLAAEKADNWWMRQHSKVMALRFKKNITKSDKTNLIEKYINQASIEEPKDIEYFDESPFSITASEIEAHKELLGDVVICSDAFFPFSDNIERAKISGCKYVAAPSGSMRDDLVIEAANTCNMTMVHTNLRLFHH